MAPMASIPAPRADVGDGAPEMLQREHLPSSEPKQAHRKGTLWHHPAVLMRATYGVLLLEILK